MESVLIGGGIAIASELLGLIGAEALL